MKSKKLLVLVLCFTLVFVLSACNKEGTESNAPEANDTQPTTNNNETNKSSNDWPNRTISMIVPFDAGGATDLIARGMQPKLEEFLGVDIAVTNMSGGSTAVGNQYVMDSEHDGYTIIMQATEISNIWTMKQSDLTQRDFEYPGIAAAVPGILVVKNDSPIKDLNDLVEIAKNEQLSVSVCGGGCAWTLTYGLLNNSIGGIEPEYVPMGSGKNAAISALKGEVDVGSCGIPEAIELLQGGELRALGCFTPESVIMDGYGEIPSIASVAPDLQVFFPYGGYVCLAVPKGVPDNVTKKLGEAFEYAFTDERLQEYLKTGYFLGLGYTGQKARDYIVMRESLNAWLLDELGIAQRNPKDLNIPHYSEY
jgi:tripartite-type tricarboxylate transporter receptor subunit TctC